MQSPGQSQTENLLRKVSELSEAEREAYQAIGEYLMTQLAKRPDMQDAGMVLNLPSVRYPLGFRIAAIYLGELVYPVEVS